MMGRIVSVNTSGLSDEDKEASSNSAGLSTDHVNPSNGSGIPSTSPKKQPTVRDNWLGCVPVSTAELIAVEVYLIGDVASVLKSGKNTQ